MSIYLAVAVLLVALLGVTVLRNLLYWLAVVLPASAYTAWQVSQAWHSSMYFWYVVGSVVLLVLMCLEAGRENDRRAAAGQPPLSKAELKARAWGR